MNTKIAASLAALLLGVFTTNAATILVDSTFTNSSLGAGGRNATNSSNLTPWFLTTSATAANAVVTDDVGGLGKSMSVLSGNTIYTAFSTASLLVGETISLTLNYRFTATPGTGSETFRAALYNSNAAAAITADISPVSSANLQQYAGYYAGLSAGSTSSANALRQRDTGVTNGLLSSTQSSSISSNTNAGVLSGTTSHSMEFSITRSNATTLLFSTKIDGTTLLTGTDSTSIYTDFNSLSIAASGGSAVMDNIMLQTVPEPATYVMFGIGAAFLLYRSRRQA